MAGVSLLKRLLLLPTAVVSTVLSHAYAQPVDREKEDNTTIPAPISIIPDQNWDGIDGSWSTFTLRVGTPEQYVRTLVSTASYQTWVVLPEGCEGAIDGNACAEDRGSLFSTNESSTWRQQGIYDLYIEKNLGLDGNAVYGFDTVGLGGKGEEGPTLENTTVGALAVTDFYLGLFGINPKPTNFSGFNDGSPSYMTYLKDQSYIPSVSFGYTAGAKYRFTGVLASLTLGGYDSSKFIENDNTFTFAADNDRDLVVAIQSITTPSQIQSSPNPTELLPSPIYAYIDSTVPQIWLPIEACRAFELEFGLVYDNTTQLYLVNDTLHDSLLARDANITLTLGQGYTSDSTVQITLPYAAFDLEAQPPYPGLANASRFFPLQRSQNDTQYTLGRTFLQEAYLSVDWESQRFNVSQNKWVEHADNHLVPIIASVDTHRGSGADGDTTNGGGSATLGSGAIAGIVVGVIAAVAIVAVGLLFLLRRKKRDTGKSHNEKSNTHSSAATVVGSTGRTNSVYPKAELEGSSTPAAENKRLLTSDGSIAPDTPPAGISPVTPGYFMHVNSMHANSISTPTSAEEGTHSSTNSGQPFSPLSATASEADGRERQIYEMPGDMPQIREKDGRALSEKEALAHRQRMYDGVDPASNSATAINEGLREPRRVDAQEVVTAGASIEPGNGTVHRAFSFEMDRESDGDSRSDLYE